MRFAFLRPAFAATAIIASAGILAGGLALRPAFAVGGSTNIGPFTVTHCTSNSPCQTYGNQGTGEGVEGNNTNKSTLGIGVNGTSTDGAGVQGTGGAVGVSAITSSTTGTALLVQSPESAQSTSLMVGKGFNQDTIFSLDSVGNAVFGDPEIGLGGSVTATGYSGNDIPLFVGSTEKGTIFELLSNGAMLLNGTFATNALASDNDSTIAVQSPVNVQAGVTADTVTSNYGLFANQLGTSTNTIAADASGVIWLYQGYSTNAGKYTVEMGDSGSVYARIFITMSEPRVVQRTSGGAQVDTYTPQITQPSLEDFGEAQLTNGVASVALDPKYAAALDESARYLVTLTPEGDCRGLYVASQSAGGFIVRELQGGHSSVAFNFRIVAKPLGDDSPRLPLSALPYGFDHTVPPPVLQRAPRRSAPRLGRPSHR